MRLLVTGSKGFVGTAFVEYIWNNTSHEVIEYDLPDDITDTVRMGHEIQKCDMVVHIAAIADLYDTAENINKNFEVNVRATFDIGRLCAEYDKKLIFISTCCVYGNVADLIETEETYPKTNEPYACSKMAGEYLLRGIPFLDYSILRIGTVYGPGMRKSLFNHIALDSFINEKPIHINGDGEQTRNYIYIDDLVEAMSIAVSSFKVIKGQIINICGIEDISVNKTIAISRIVTGRETYIHNSIDRYGEIKHENISIDKAERLLGWSPETKYIDGMKKTYEWMKNGTGHTNCNCK